MSTTQLLIRLPDELARRLKRSVAPRQRSKFIQRLLEEALPLENGDDDPLYRAAMAVEKEEALAAEMDEWDLPAAYEALGRSHSVAGNLAESRRYVGLGREATAKIEDEDDRKHMEADFATIDP